MAAGDKKFGAIVNGERLKKGLTLSQLGRLAGVNPNYIGQIERGYKWPCDAIRTALVKALGLPNDLIGVHPDSILDRVRTIVENDSDYLASFDQLLSRIERQEVGAKDLCALLQARIAV